MSSGELAKYRFEVAQEKLNAARILLANGFFKDAISRSYYAILAGVRSVLALKGLDSAKHSGVISFFNQNFVKTGIVSKICSKILAKAKIYREKGDYGDFSIVTEEEAKEQIENTEKFLHEIKRHLDSQLNDEPWNVER